MAGHFLFPSFSICLYLFVSQAAGSLLRFRENAKNEVFTHQITLADPRQQHLDMTDSSTAADFEQWKKHQLAPLYILRTLIGFNLWWLLTIVGLKIKARIQLKQ